MTTPKPEPSTPQAPNGSADERARVAAEVADQLRRRGVRLTGDETDDELADLLEAVERFEDIVERQGGDLMVDEPVNQGDAPSEPDDRAFVLPMREIGEKVATFIGRITDAALRAGRRGDR